jgi:uncharacterized membrane protein
MLFFQLIWENFETEIDKFPPLVFFSEAIGKFLLTVTPLIINPFVETDIIREGVSLILPNGLYISYFFYLSGIKQMCFLILLFAIATGPWAKKVWYVPLILLIVQLTVLVRFLALNLYCLVQPEQFHLLKDLFFIPLFYFEILLIWMTWVLIVGKTASLRKTQKTNHRN